MKCPRCGYVPEGRSLRSSRLFHALIKAYSKASGLGFDHAKVEIKFQFGIWESYPFEADPPEWRGAFVEVYPGTMDHGFVYLKSEAEYSQAEESQVIEGAMITCIESGADVEEIVRGLREE